MQDPLDNSDGRKTGTSNSARVDSLRRKDDDRRMESHIETLDKRMAAVETDVAVIRSNYATRADLATLESNMIRWVVASAIAQLGLVTAFIKYMH